MARAKFTTIIGRGLAVPGNDIDTVRIIPARFLKAVTFDGMGEGLFFDARKAATAADVTKSVEAWATAWSKKDVKGYLSHYAADFKTPSGESRAKWEADRAQRIDKPGVISVSVEGMQVEAEGANKATARFRQLYRSAKLKTSSRKALVLVRQDGKWLIQQERIGN